MNTDDDAHLRETLVSREELARGNFLQIRRDTVQLPDGGRATREYVVHPGAVVIVPLLQEAGGPLRLVLERQFRYPLGRSIIEFPAGKLDPGEDLLACAQRELSEETGYRATAWAQVGTLHPVPAYSTEFISLWFARGLQEGARKLDQGEFLDVFTATPQELFGWCREGKVTDSKTLIAALWLQNWLSGEWSLDWRSPSGDAAAG